MPIETRDVLAGAYLHGRRSGSMLRHAVEVDARGEVVRVLCGRVAIDHLADQFASDPKADPTCPRCQSALKKR